MKNKIWVVVILAFFAIPIVVPLLLANSDYCRIVEQDYSGVLNQDGSMTITERLTFDVHAASETPNEPDGATYWELWRDLPEEYVDGFKVEYDVLSVTRLSVNGDTSQRLEFQPASRLYWYNSDYTSTSSGLGPNRYFHSKGPFNDYDRFECVLLYVDGLYRETVEFEIVYIMYNAAIQYADCTELYISIFASDDIDHLTSVKAEIKIPDGQMPASGNFDVNTYGTSKHSFPWEKKTQGGYTIFSFALGEKDLKFNPYNKYIEFSLVSHGKDAGTLAPSGSKSGLIVYDKIVQSQKEYDELPAKFATIKTFVFLGFAALSVLILYIVIKVCKGYKEKYKITSPAIPFERYREIPSQLDVSMASSLVFCKHKQNDVNPGVYSAAMLSLIRKKYISAERVNMDKEWSNSNTLIKIRTDFGENERLPMSHTEENYYNLIRKNAPDGEITISKLTSKMAADYQYTLNFAENTNNMMKNVGKAQGYIQKADYKKPKIEISKRALSFMIFGVIFLIVANIISIQTRLDAAFGAYFIFGGSLIAAGVLFYIYSKSLILLTQFGQDEYAKWRGLYNFMQDETLMNEQTVDKIDAWEDYLIYATAFGIPDKVLKALETKFPNYNMESSLILRHPFLCSNMFVRTTAMSFRSAVSSASFRSSSGGHGGYGGGGRGGGGGGGGH